MRSFAAPAARMWTALADTRRYNEASGLPRQRIEERVAPDGTVVFVARARFGPFELVWDDLPCNWITGRWFEHARLFHGGPFRSLTARFDLTPEGAGCHGYYRLEVEPRGVLGRLILAAGFMRGAERGFRRLAAQAEAFARGSAELPFQPPPPRLPAVARERALRIGRELDTDAYGHDLARRLVDLVLSGPETELEHLRPLALARRWNVPPRHAVELCLEATRLGLLQLRWSLLCPRCRGAKADSASLDRLPSGAHCGTCNIDYGRDFARNVELSFAPDEAIRPTASGEFCLLGPMTTPHIWAHLTLEPGERRIVRDVPGPGLWRLRTLEAGGQQDVDVGEGGFPAVAVVEGGVESGPPPGDGTLALENHSQKARTVVIEDRRWTRDVLTADRAASFQAFRDLFSAEVLRPGDEVGIERVALLFSDLRGSTALYTAIGDAGAYHLVREHFAYLAAIVREHDGAIVKTIGDAVMAAFHEPTRALEAAIAMQERVQSLNARTGRPVVLKLGLHAGPCIAVTLNDRLDYFGTTVNLAARLQGQSRGEDVVLSDALAADPDVVPMLEGLAPTHEQARLKGFVEPVGFVRLAFPEPAVTPPDTPTGASTGPAPV
ncbi:MAG: hypothetical protein GC201_01845 [Alphaproteobacteria bacterium]|nr:hypothetical protein [Alphaproteobacteria bacterium]